MRQFSYVLLIVLLGYVDGEFAWGGPLDDASCNAEAIYNANDAQIHSILDSLLDTSFFRLYPSTPLELECPYWKSDDDIVECETVLEEGPAACSLDVDPMSSAYNWPFAPMTDEVDRTISLEEFETAPLSLDCTDAGSDMFWSDICGPATTDAPVDYLNLALNPERWTGYNGSHIWKAIYAENCFHGESEQNMCYEERVLYRLLSGMHSATNIHIASNYYPPSKKAGRDEWTANPERFAVLFKNNPERLRNLHFAFAVMLRAVGKASPFLYNYDFEDERTLLLVRRLLDSHILEECSEVFTSFDESRMFHSTAHTLKHEFKGVFQNISTIIDCVTCQKCRLHGKLKLLGLGVTLKILLLPEHLLADSISRDELVAFINTLGSFSDAIEAIYSFEEHLKEPDLVLKRDTVIDQAFNSLRSVEQSLTIREENRLVDAIIAHNDVVLLLASHYHDDPSRFTRHALRHLESGGVDAIVVGGGLAGLTSALRLLDKGLTVMLLDKEAFLGGNSAKASSGINAAVKLEEVSSFHEDTLISSGYTDSILIETLVNQSGWAKQWLESRTGLQLDILGQLGGHSRPRTYRPEGGMAGAELIRALQVQLKGFISSGKLILKTQTVVSKLILDGSVVVGVEYDTDGVLSEAYATNVILACGGYAGSPELLKSYRPDLANFGTTNGRFATGDGLSLAKDVGAALIELDLVQVHPTAFNVPGSVKPLCAELLRGVGGILLNKNGQRFCNELGTRDYVVDKMLQSADGDDLDFVLVLNNDAAMEANKHVPFFLLRGYMQELGGVGQLSEFMNVSESILRTTLDDYGHSVFTTSDPFGRTSFGHGPLDADASMFVGHITPAVHYSMGGVAVDERTRALKTDKTVVEGLYVIGELAGGIHGKNRLGGNSLTDCVVFGLVAADSISSILASSSIEPTHSVSPKPSKDLGSYTLDDVAVHNNAESCWLVLFGEVYDVTDFLDEHPSGAQAILDYAGTDASIIFSSIHSMSMLEDLTKIGTISS